jgi:hypothetical protein
VRVGMEVTGYSRWFERLLAELGFELWIGDPAARDSLHQHDHRLRSSLSVLRNLQVIWGFVIARQSRFVRSLIPQSLTPPGPVGHPHQQLLPSHDLELVIGLALFPLAILFHCGSLV